MTGALRSGLAQLRAVFERHADRHLTIPIDAPEGISACWRSGRIEVGLPDLGEGRDGALPPFVLESATARSVSGQGGARTLSLRLGHGESSALLSGGGLAAGVRLSAPSRKRLERARRAHVWTFATVLAAASPHLLRWLGDRTDPARVARLRDALGLSHVTPARDLDPSRLTPVPAPLLPRPDRPVVLVLPVHQAFDLLPEVIHRIERYTDLPFELVVVEDASPDARIRPWLRERLAGFRAGRVHLIENARNLGFVASANLGLEVAVQAGAHACLLNTDSFVPAGWASRLFHPILADPGTVASATPFSGAAGLTSVPAIGAGGRLPRGLADRLDRLAQERFGARAVELPTGMGFCMAMSAEFLRRFPSLDPVFGAGYGEETDWCCRVTAAGGRHLAVGGLFVDHLGSASFGREQRDRRAQKAAAMIRDRHPGYEVSVARFVEHDPLLTERLALGIALAAAQEPPLPIYLAHSLGGGAEADLVRRLQALTEAGGRGLVLRVGGLRRWQIELHGPDHSPVTASTDSVALIHQMLAPVARRHLIYSCGVGDHDLATLPDVLLSLVPHKTDRLEMLWHDHLPVSPSFTLLGSDGWYHGVPGRGCPDPAHSLRRANGRPVSPGAWQDAWARVIARADRIVVFSPFCVDLIRQVWPDLDPPIVLLPHPVPSLPGPLPLPAGGTSLGVLGNMRMHKGAEVVTRLARLCPRLTIKVVGAFEPGLAVPANVEILGAYRRDEIPDIARGAGIGAWIIPSIWPETFCHALHEALATGLPVVGFALGAQGGTLETARADGKPVIAVPAGADPLEAAAALRAGLCEVAALLAGLVDPPPKG